MLSRLQRKVGLAVSGVAETKEGEEVERAAGGSGTLSVTMEIYHNFCLTSLFISLKMFLYRLNPPTIHFSAQIIGEIIHVIKECKSSLEKSEPFWLLSNVSFLFVFFSGTASCTSSPLSGTGSEALSHLLIMPLVWCLLALEFLQDPYSETLHRHHPIFFCHIHSLFHNFLDELCHKS